MTSRCLGPNPVRTLQQRGILSRLSFREVPVPAVSRLPSAERSLEARALDPGRFRAFIALIRNISGTGRVLAFHSDGSVREPSCRGAPTRGSFCEGGVVVLTESRTQGSVAGLSEVERCLWC